MSSGHTVSDMQKKSRIAMCFQTLKHFGNLNVKKKKKSVFMSQLTGEKILSADCFGFF